jgi:hypothetical protein
MRQRAVSLALEIGWMVPWLIVLHAGGAWWVPLLAGVSLLLIATSSHRATFGPIAIVIVLALGYLFGGGLGLAAAAVGAWRGWGAHGMQSRSALMGRLVMVLMTMAILVIMHPPWWPVLPGALVLAVAGLAEAARPPGVGSREWWGLGSAFGLVALGIAVVIYGLALWGPWKHLAGPVNAGLAFVVRAVAYTLVRLLTRIHFYGLHLHIPRLPRSPGHKAKPRPATGDHHLILIGLLALGGAAVIALGVSWLSRALARWDPAPDEAEEHLERRGLADRYAAQTGRVRLTRRVVQRRLRRAFRRRVGAHPHETLREWFGRIHRSDKAGPVDLYEQVRYGGTQDSQGRATRAAREWPPDPRLPPRG